MIIIIINNSALKRVNPDYEIYVYQASTGMDGLQSHLTSDLHINQWINQLTKKNITVKAKGGLKAIANYQGKPFDSQAPSCLFYSPEIFVDTLVDFIVATNQIFFFSPLALQTLKSFVLYVLCSGKILRRKIFHTVPQLEQEFQNMQMSILRPYLFKCG